MIRPITAQDEAVFLQLAHAFYHSDAVHAPIPAQFHADTFAELMRSRDYLEALLLEQNGQAVGYALFAKTFSQEAGGLAIWIEEIYILPSHRGCGLGKQVFAYLEEHLPAARYRLEVEPDNTRALALYESLGYTPMPYLDMKKQVRIK